MAGEQLRVTEGEETGTLLSVEAELPIGRLAPVEEGRLGGDPEISRRHARVSRRADGALEIEDLASANGTFVNDERLTVPRTLEPGDVIRIGRTVMEVTAAPAPAPPLEVVVLITPVSGGSRRIAVRDELTIGRDVSGEGRLADDPQMSRRHARVGRDEQGRATIEDLGSANGTFVNGERVDVVRALGPGDVVQIGSATLRLADAALMPVDPPPAPPARPPAPAARPVAAPARPRAPRAVQAPDPAGIGAIQLPVGSVFAKCRVEDVIGHGDMGVVYRAEELALQRPVALKLILPEYSDDARFRERFRRESRIAAAIDHQNVIPVFDAGDEAGVLYIMMRLVEGTDLRTLIAAEGSLEPRRAARIVRQVGAALDAAHARGMLHRDVKPSNVLLTRRDHVYLSDFGLAKEASSDKGLTRQGTVIARAEYVAPEQILNQPVDSRADTYALGCLLFEALTGEPPFARWTEGPGALAHLEGPRPSPLELRPDLPREFDEVVRRAMATDPRERYPSAGDLGRAAMLAVGGRRRAGPWSVVATGPAASIADARDAPAPQRGPSEPSTPDPGSDRGQRQDLLRWVIAVAGLVIVAVGMVSALHGISTL
jgi:pSer/pThr/pTyr-binding forkhead associated (FHA) protein/predicted Ser/Thr protein kinase